MNPKEFMRRWFEGMKNLSPADMQRTRSYVILGQIVGIVFAMIVMFYKSLWYWEIFMLFFLLTQFMDYIQTRQKLQAMINITKQMELITRKSEVEENGH